MAITHTTGSNDFLAPGSPRPSLVTYARENRLLMVGDRLARRRDDAAASERFARGRGAHGEADFLQGQIEGLDEVMTVLSDAGHGSDPVGTGLTSVRQLCDRWASKLPSQLERTRAEGQLSAGLEVVHDLLKLRLSE